MSKAYIYEQKSILKTARIWLDANNAASLGNPVNDDPISQWNDVSGSGNNATQTTPANQPLYKTNAINGLPVLSFNGTSNFFNLPDGTIPYGNSSYTVFIVSKSNTVAIDTQTFLAAGGGAGNQALGFRYASGSLLNDYWWANDIVSATLTITDPNIATFTYNNAVGRAIFHNGVDITEFSAAVSSTSRNTVQTNNFIGKNTSGQFLNSGLGEIIIFDRALNTTQRKAIEEYLSNKWSI